LKDDSAAILTEIWNRLFLNKSIEVCTERLQGIGFLELKVLKLIYFNPDYKIKDFIDKLVVPNSTFTNIINRLVKKDLVNRKIDQGDLRSFGLELTLNGTDAIKEHLDAEVSIFEGILDRLNEIERKEFVGIMRKIVESDVETSEY
jgi:DNA-binding MarR family transcriptional regulator